MQEKKEILRNPVRNGFLGPKNKFLKTGIGNLGDGNEGGRRLTAARVMAMATATTWVMVMVTRLAGDEEGG